MNAETTLYKYVMTRLQEKRITQRAVAIGSGVPFSTVCKIAQGSVKEPSVHTIQKLYDFFKLEDANQEQERKAA